MALVKIVNLGDNSRNQLLINNEVHYILRVDDSDNYSIGVRYYGGSNFLISSYQDIVYQFETVRAVHHKKETIQGRPFILAFSHEYDQINAYQAYLIALHVLEYFGTEYQVLFGVHEDTDDLHVHFFINATNIYTGRMLNFNIGFIRGLMNHIRMILNIPGLWFGKKQIILSDHPMEN